MADQQTALEAAARDALRAWPVQAHTVRLISHSENYAFRVDAGDGRRFVLRMHRPWYHTRTELESEHLFTQALRAAGISTPTALRTNAGELYAKRFIAPLNEHREVGLLHWVDGTIMRDRTRGASAGELDVHYHRLGALCARLHAAAAAFEPPDGFTRHRLDADGLMGTTPFWGRFWEHPALPPAIARRFADARAQLHARLRDMGTRSNFSLIHADLHPGNVVLTDADVHIIDFDDSGFGWHAHDLAVALFDHAGSAEHGALRDALLRGYREVRALPAAIEDDIATFTAIRGLAIIGWLMQRPEVDGHDLNAHLARVGRLLDEIGITATTQR